MARPPRAAKTAAVTKVHSVLNTYNDLVYVDVSSLPNAGNGLFAKRPITAGMRLTFYGGRRFKQKDMHHHENSQYVFGPVDGFFYDAKNEKRDSYLGRFANDPIGPTRIKGNADKVNATISRDHIYAEETSVFSLRSIEPGEEIFVDYSEDYWKRVQF